MTDKEGDEGRIDAELIDDPDSLRAVLDITGFQRDLLLSVAGASKSHPSGQTVRCFLEGAWGKEVNESRLYQNLEKLRQDDLVTSYPLDGRTKGYCITDRGRSLMRAYCTWAAGCLAEDEDRDSDEDRFDDGITGPLRWKHDL